MYACHSAALQQPLNTYENICDKHDLKFIPLAFDTFGRMHPDSAKALHNVFINHRHFCI